MIKAEVIQNFLVPSGKKVRLKDYDTDWKDEHELPDLGLDTDKERARIILERNLKDLADAQDLLFADDRYSLLVILQAMDAAGKDGTIKHVMSGVNPQGCQVYSFKKPSPEELDHNFLWRCSNRLPERGRIGIFNRSYYEEVLVVKVHPELLDYQRLPTSKRGKSFWEKRYEDINTFEHHLHRNGTQILKFYLHVSPEVQKQRFMERIDTPEKNWKFAAADVAERAFWKEYMEAYEEALSATSTKWAPWYVIPADNKWATRALVADIITTRLRSLDLKYPEISDSQKQALEECRQKLLNEKSS